MRLSPQSLALASSRRPKLTLAAWGITFVAAMAASGALLPGALTTDADFTNEPEAKRAKALLEAHMPGAGDLRELVIVHSEALTVDDAAFKAQVGGVESALSGLGDDVVAGLGTFYATGDASLVSEDRHTTLVPVTLAGEQDDVSGYAADLVAAVEESAGAGFTVLPFGPASLGQSFSEVAEDDMRTGESFGLLAALVVLVAVFGSVVAGLLPILIGLVSIVVAVGLVAVAGQFFSFSFFVTNMIGMMGLALGIDYSLFIVSRYREERRRGRDKHDAIAAAGGSASRAVLFSGMTVVVALLGMFIVPMTIFRSLAAGAVFVAVVSVFASLTLLPAVLSLLGDKIDALSVQGRWSAMVVRRRRRRTLRDGVPTYAALERPAGDRSPFWENAVRRVMSRPVLSLVLGVGALLAAATPYLDVSSGFSGVSTLPRSSPARQAFTLLAEGFPGGLESPVQIVVAGDVAAADAEAAVERLRTTLASDAFFGPATVTPTPDGEIVVVSAALRGDPTSAAASAAVGRVRDDYVPAAFGSVDGVDVLVGGETAFNKDFFDLNDRYLPLVIGLVLALSFVLLTVVFRSVVVPVKAIVMNLLSVGAAYGLLVLVSQKGVGAGVLGFQQVESVEAWLPLFLFCVLFGLSMDYHVFLLSRVREHFAATGDNTESVAHGVGSTAGIITGAALIMVAVFGGFASGEMVSFQQMGFGLAVAVLIDATIVRSVLVPASMKLLGARNWYLPRWLEWLPKLDVEGPGGDDGGAERPGGQRRRRLSRPLRTAHPVTAE